ncbi:PC4/YdbC family ssDNA-binding protein [Paucilactobacillus suebicus]|uniref:Transcriptional coactivator p15 (PC4) C-terminal domain-containing protein n=1 Tax=Paucilactobacillus suebicus DSM 5007 = KCTC 3549 TaxID=1423807 RepID=A0A0R1W9R0_9LACO|nr:PC4/YdbC family ssDNA-binding protein [Paucilactobacillus suebicus]KRM12249.1 hypothetical protein FD16_GL002434 [Paucilactobacillus suebicus DSM 5007 = KCTC 3549]
MAFVEGTDYEIIEKIGVIRNSEKSPIELNNIHYAKIDEDRIDLRKWYDDKNGDHKMAKGVSMTIEEARKLRDLLDDYLD